MPKALAIKHDRQRQILHFVDADIIAKIWAVLRKIDPRPNMP